MAKSVSKVAAPAKKAVAKAAEPAKKAVAKAAEPAKKAVPAAKKAVSAAKAAVAPKKKAAGSELKDVVFNVYSPDSKSVEIAGEFNDWTPSKGKMKKDKDGNWTLKLKLAKGSYQYKVVFDGTSWELDQKADSVMAEHGPNSIVHVD